MTDENRKWIESTHGTYTSLTEYVSSVLKSALNAKGIAFLSITPRTKSIESVLGKIRRKGYHEPSKQMTDVSGIRVITYFESGVEEICSIIRELFDIDDRNSLDKSMVLGTDKLGYRSVHFVCSLGEQRVSLLENSAFRGLVCEIQVRTVLQHAWAELAHDRNYHFTEGLPAAIERELNLYAGLLEIADRGFDKLAKTIDDYIESVTSKAKLGKLDVDINALSLGSFVASKRPEFSIPVYTKNGRVSECVKELEEFGASTLADVDDLFSQAYIDATNKHCMSTTALGLVRGAMLFKDIKKYLAVPSRVWSGIHADTVNMLSQKYGKASLRRTLHEFDIVEIDENPDDDVEF